MVSRHRQRALYAFAAGAAFFATSPVWASDLIVEVRGIRSMNGELGCAIFSGPAGFPREPSRAAQQDWQPVKGTTMSCRFGDLKPGRYAVAVTHDLNGNHRTDTNFFGIPTEQWGVSNNVRPSLRAPRFDEAEFGVTDASPMTIDIQLSR